MGLKLSGELILKVSEKPIKFLGRWIRAEGKDGVIIKATHEDLITYLSRLDLSSLTGLQKCWGYQYMVLPKMKWPLAIYDIPISLQLIVLYYAALFSLSYQFVLSVLVTRHQQRWISLCTHYTLWKNR